MLQGDLLIIEDDPDDLAAMIDATRKLHLSAIPRVARDGEEAIAELSRDPLPGLVTLDLNLPKISGFEVLKRMRAEDRTRRVPVVVVSASSADRDIESAYEGGANSYVVKPVNYADYDRVLGDIIRYWLRINSAPRSGSAGRRAST